MAYREEPVILTIDDEKSIRKSFRRFLEDLDYNVLEGENGRKGIEIFEKNKIDLILVDLRMPEMDGLDVLSYIKENSPETPLIVVSGTGKIGDVIEALHLGAWDYILKPVEDLTVLEHAVEKALERARLIRENRDYQKELEKKVSQRTKELEKANTDLIQKNQELKLYSEIINKNKERLSMAMEVSDAYVWEQNLKTGKVQIDDKFYKNFGYRKDDLKESVRGFEKITDKEELENYNRSMLDHIKGKTPFHSYEIKVRKKNGQWRWMCIRARVVGRDTEGNPENIIGISMDITKIKQAEEQKRMLEVKLQQAQKMEAIGTLAGGIAHDFNNILMAIQGHASLMLLDIDRTHSHFEHLKEIEQYVRSAATLTKQLLGFARGGQYEVIPTDLNSLVEKTSKMFGRTRKELTIYTKYQKNIWTVEVDQGQIEQVLLNLYVNAWQAMPEGGNIYLETKNIVIGEDFAESFNIKIGAYVKFSITDTGTGMDENTRQRIFDPFFTTKEMGRGTGLGLASAYGIIKNHRGIINVYSEKGEGATFNIYLPSSEKEAIPYEESKKNILKGEGTLLLIDDEEMIIEIAQLMLKRMGYKVITATEGKKAIELYKENLEKIDLVILDMIMPGMGGKKVYENLKKVNPGVKVILSSGYSLKEEIKKLLEEPGCLGFIQKPFTINELSILIKKIIIKDTDKNPL